MQHYEIKFVTCNRSVVLTGCSGFPHQYNSPPWHNWTIVESGITHHKQNKTKTLFTTVNFSLIGSNIPTVSAYRNYISQLLPYLSGYTHWWFVTTPTLSEWLHTLVICWMQKQIKQGYVAHMLESSLNNILRWSSWIDLLFEISISQMAMDQIQIQKVYLKPVHFLTTQQKLSRAFQTDMHNKIK